jgi:hypothetical protein
VRIPSWVLSTKELRRWRDVQGVLLFPGWQAQLVLRDNGEPVFVMFSKPLLLKKENGAVLGTFKIELPGDAYKMFLAGPYYRCLQGFSVDVQPQEFDFLVRHPEIARYLNMDERDRIKKILSEQERKEAWLAKRQDFSSGSRLSPARISGSVDEVFLRPGSSPS